MNACYSIIELLKRQHLNRGKGINYFITILSPQLKLTKYGMLEEFSQSAPCINAPTVNWLATVEFLMTL